MCLVSPANTALSPCCHISSVSLSIYDGGGKEPTSDGLYEAEEALRVDCVLVEGDNTLWVKPAQQSVNCWLLKGTTAESW